jgi:hypothetical protein
MQPLAFLFAPSHTQEQNATVLPQMPKNYQLLSNTGWFKNNYKNIPNVTVWQVLLECLH